jgi:hypothetical protein
MNDDLISRKAAIDGVKKLHEVAWKNWHEPTLSSNAVIDMIKDLPSAQPEPLVKESRTLVKDLVKDTISRQAAIDLAKDLIIPGADYLQHNQAIMNYEAELVRLPSAQPEPLTDKEQRIFLAAMGREEKVCEEVDRNYVREPYEDSLVRVCKEIRRKVKGALWI